VAFPQDVGSPTWRGGRPVELSCTSFPWLGDPSTRKANVLDHAGVYWLEGTSGTKTPVMRLCAWRGQWPRNRGISTVLLRWLRAQNVEITATWQGVLLIIRLVCQLRSTKLANFDVITKLIKCSWYWYLYISLNSLMLDYRPYLQYNFVQPIGNDSWTSACSSALVATLKATIVRFSINV